MARFVRSLFGFALACLAAAVTQVLFVITPSDLYLLEADQRLEQAGRAMALALSAATQFAIFAAPFALAAIVFGFVQGFRGWAYYVFVGLAIALLGFAALYAGETRSEFTIANSYAVAAFAFSGIIAGYVFWLIAGRGPSRRPDFTNPRIETENEESGPRGHLKAKDYERAEETSGKPAAPVRDKPAASSPDRPASSLSDKPASSVPDKGLRKTH